MSELPPASREIAITIYPRMMRQTLLDNPASLAWELLYEVYDHDQLRYHFRTLREERSTSDGYRLLWIHSLGKEISADAGRMKAIKKTTDELLKLRHRLQSPRTRMRDRPSVAEAVEKILAARGLSDAEIESLPRYHEGRDCRRPTTRRVIEAAV